MAKIQDYAVIGNCRSAALISKEGSIDWLCLPKFDSPSLFAALLDDEGGFWKIAPETSSEISREYLESTNILKTEFRTETGIAILTDFMPIFSEEEKKKKLQPNNEIVRFVEVLKGFVDLEIVFQPKPNFALSKAKLKNKGKLGIRIETPELFTLQSSCTLEIHNNIASTSLRLLEKEFLSFSLTYHADSPAILSLLDKTSIQKKIDESKNWWQNWASNIQYSGEYRKEVVRSALILKLLNYTPSGTFIAAPTTSLPERLGYSYNWDYRFAWLRDCAFITNALYELGLIEEADSFINWLLYSTKLSFFKLNPLYDVFGRDCCEEKILKHFKGYSNSKPVRIQNAASQQFQLDIYGEIAKAVSLLMKSPVQNKQLLFKELVKLGKFVCRNWEKPDNGIWESREKKTIHTYSLLMCWVLFESILKMAENLNKKIKEKFHTTQKNIKDFIEKNCWNASLDSYVDRVKGDEVGASLLLLAINGFEMPESIRMQKTYAKIQERLQHGPSLYFRNENAKSKHKGAFFMCSFWNVEYLSLRKETLQEAKESFEKCLMLSNDLGLFSEDFDSRTKDFLGNFPQGLSHSGLINAAIALEKRKEKDQHTHG